MNKRGGGSKGTEGAKNRKRESKEEESDHCGRWGGAERSTRRGARVKEEKKQVFLEIEGKQRRSSPFKKKMHVAARRPVSPPPGGNSAPPSVHAPGRADNDPGS